MKAWQILGGIAGLGIVTYVALPKVLNRLGLHPHYEGRRYNLVGKRALVITTSHDTLGESGKATGVFGSEMTVPYYEFLDANMQVDVASIKGGPIPIEAMSLRWPLATPSDKRYGADPDLEEKVQHSLKVDDVDFTRYDLVYMAGGWGAAYDLGTSEVLGRKISEAYAAGAVLGSVCHGALGLLQATDESGELLLKGRHVTAVTDKQVQELGITITPQHPETEVRKAGAIFESKTAARDMLANLTVVDGRIVTGQNQNAGAETAQRMMGVLVQEMAKE